VVCQYLFEKFLRNFLKSLIAEELATLIPTEKPVMTTALVSLGKQRVEVRGPEHQTGETATHEGERIHHRENILS
jgi:hypothetical protein